MRPTSFPLLGFTFSCSSLAPAQLARGPVRRSGIRRVQGRPTWGSGSARRFNGRWFALDESSSTIAPSAGAASSALESAHVRLLSRDVVSRIAAGEVVDGLPSIVRELIENSVDANARSVRVDVDTKARSVTVVDDGVGISLEQGILDVATCNTTSKIRSVQDLECVRTLGFRGQGLWAIREHAAKLSVSSRPRSASAPLGHRVVFRPEALGQDHAVQPVPMACGTIVQATGVGERIDFSKAAIRQVRQLLFRSALVHSSTAFTFSSQGQVLGNWSSEALVEDIGSGVMEAFARELRRSTGEFRNARVEDVGFGSVDVVIGLPSRVHFASSSNIFIAINGRVVENGELLSHIRRIVRSQVPSRRYPAVFVCLRVAAEHGVDWNVHPMKQKMRFWNASDLARAKELVSAAVESALRVQSGNWDPLGAVADEATSSTAARGAVAKHGVSRMLMDTSSSSSRETSPVSVPSSGSEAEAKSAFLNIRAVAQVLNTYIVAEYDSGIWLVEQHVADERGKYEDLLRGWVSGFVKMSEPVKLPQNLADDDERMLALSNLGFAISDSGSTEGSSTMVSSCQRMMLDLDDDEFIRVLAELSADDQSIESAAATLSCRTAVRNGTELSIKRMQKIVDALVKCSNPHTCPHGRPIFLELAQQDLLFAFKRQWVPTRSQASSLGIPRRGVLER